MVSEPGWPRLIEVNERVEVVFDGFLGTDRFIAIGKREWGTVVTVDVITDPDDPHYLVELDHVHPEIPGVAEGYELHPNETLSRRWFAWEFVRPLNLLELIAEAAR